MVLLPKDPLTLSLSKGEPPPRPMRGGQRESAGGISGYAQGKVLRSYADDEDASSPATSSAAPTPLAKAPLTEGTLV